jgi:hypothetical protein
LFIVRASVLKSNTVATGGRRRRRVLLTLADQEEEALAEAEFERGAFEEPRRGSAATEPRDRSEREAASESACGGVRGAKPLD